MNLGLKIVESSCLKT